MKRKDIPTVLNTLNEVSEMKGVKFAFSVLKNRKTIESQMESDREIFEKILIATDEYKDFEAKRIELCVLHSEKDDNGEPVVENDQYKIIDTQKFGEELNTISEQFKDAIDGRQKQIEDYNSLMEDELTLEFKKVSFEDLPQDITEKQLRQLEFMIILD